MDGTLMYATYTYHKQESMALFKYDQGYGVMCIYYNGGMCTINVPHIESLSHKPNHNTWNWQGTDHTDKPPLPDYESHIHKRRFPEKYGPMVDNMDPSMTS